MPATPKPSNRAAILARLSLAVPKEHEIVVLDLEDDQPPLELECRALTAGARWQIQQVAFHDQIQADGETKNVVLPTRFYPELIARSYVVPGTEDRVWTDGDLDAIRSLALKHVDKLSEVALRLAGWNKPERDKMAKNSDGAAISEPPST